MPLESKTFPAQQREALQLQLDAIRANQETVGELLYDVLHMDAVRLEHAQILLESMHKQDRDAILRSGGIFTDEQIKELT